MGGGSSVAVKQGIIPANPCDAAELPKVERHEIKPLTDQEIPLFLAAIEGNPMQNAYALCLFAGLREGECLGLSWKQVGFQKGRLTISQQLQREKGCFTATPSALCRTAAAFLTVFPDSPPLVIVL